MHSSRPPSRVSRPAAFFLFLVASASALLADDSRRLFDFTPVSSANAVVATIDGRIAIPLSELRAYRDAERLNAITDPASLAQKRAVLDPLIDEYLAVDEAHRTGVAESRGFVKQMEATRTMILTDFMSERALREAAAQSAPAADADAALADRLFEAATIDISNEAFALLRQVARAIDTASAASSRGPLVDPPQLATAKLHAILNQTPEAVLARYEGKTVSVKQLLAIYAGLPEPRPRVDTEPGLLGMLKRLIAPELMALEAARLGLAEAPAFQQKLVQNRNALLRFHMHGLIDREANAIMKTPAWETELRAWYEAHRADYAMPGEARRLATYAEARRRVEGDCSVALRDRLLAERAQALRRTRTVQIDEAVLQAL